MFIVMSEKYMERLMACSRGSIEECREHGVPGCVIDEVFSLEDMADALLYL